MSPGDYLEFGRARAQRQAALSTMIAELRDVADHLTNRPLETCFANLPERGNDAMFPGCKSFDATNFPTPATIQSAIDDFEASVDNELEAWDALDPPVRRGLPPPYVGR